MQEIEIEFKNLLTKDEFDRLLRHYPFPKKPDIQINYYFDTESQWLAQHHYALRIREKNHKYTLTLKQPHGHHILETHDELSESEALSWMNGHIIPKQNTTRQLNDIQISPTDLTYLGQLKTERYSYALDDKTIVLDYSMYNGQFDYELEVEATNEDLAISFFNQLLDRHQIKKRHTPNKIERFFTTRS